MAFRAGSPPRPDSRTGPLADLARSTTEQKEAELKVKQLQREIAQMNRTQGLKDARSRILLDAQKRRQEVIDAQVAAEKVVGAERERAARDQRQFCSEQRVRKKTAQDSMVDVFVSKRKEVEDFRRSWEKNTRSILSQSKKEQEQVLAAAAAERQDRPVRRKQMMEAVMQEKKEAHAQRQRELVQTRKVLVDHRRDELDARAARARDERTEQRENVRRARTAVEDDRRETKLRVVRDLQKVRERELRLLAAEVRSLEREKAMIGS